jgi:transaldolase
VQDAASEGNKVNVTLIFLRDAGVAGREGRAPRTSARSSAGLDDIGTTGMNLIRENRRHPRQLRVYDRGPRRQRPQPIHIVEAARMGADVVTVPAAIIEQSFKHPLTDLGLEKFLKDWEKSQAAVKGEKPDRGLLFSPMTDKEPDPVCSRRSPTARRGVAAATSVSSRSVRPAS